MWMRTVLQHTMAKKIMITKTTRIVNKDGFHLRPMMQFMHVSTQFMRCKITLKNGDKEADAKKPDEIITLEALYGDEIIVTAEGKNEAKAVDAVVRFFEGCTGFDKGQHPNTDRQFENNKWRDPNGM